MDLLIAQILCNLMNSQLSKERNHRPSYAPSYKLPALDLKKLFRFNP